MFAVSPVVPLTTTTKFADGTIAPISPLSVTQSTGEKPQSKLWTNEGQWWCVMPDSSGTWIWRLDGNTWNHVLQLSAQNGFHADVYSQGDVTQILLVDKSDPTNSKLASVEYVAGGLGSYQLWTARPNLVSIPLSGNDETATLTVDSTGRMWVASDVTSTIEVRYSDFPYLSFSSPITIGTGINSDDISVITSLPDGSVGLFWSNQNAKRFQFSRHVDGADATSWSPVENVASQAALNVGTGMADDHMSVAVATDGTMYVAVKTSYDTAGKTKIGMLVRRPNGVWDPKLYNVDTGGTRPIIVLDQDIDRLMVLFATSTGGGDIVYRETSLDNIVFGPRVTLLTGSLDNPSSTKQIVGGSLVVMAGNGQNSASKAQSAIITIPLPGGGQGQQPIFANAGADQTIQLPAGVPLNGTVSSGGTVLPSDATTHTWSMTSGPGTVTFADASSLDTTATFSVFGTYVLRLTANDGNGPAFDELTVVVNPVAPPAGSLPITVSFQDGNGYSGTRDTTITAKSATKNQGAAKSVTLDGSPDIAGLLRWDIGSIPQGAVVQSVSITLNVTDPAPQSYQLYELKQNWTELGATFRKFSATSNWATAGALGATDRGATVLGTLTATAKGKVIITLNAAGIAVVQNWISNPSSNFGFIFQNYANSNTQLAFDSREAKTVANRPKLSVTYAIPMLFAAAGDDQEIQLTDLAVLHGTASYSVAPNPSRPLTISWTMTSGPGTAAFADATALDTTATFDTAGTYVLRLTLDDGVQTVFDELTIVVDPAVVII
jgi:hypothetical protein